MKNDAYQAMQSALALMARAREAVPADNGAAIAAFNQSEATNTLLIAMLAQLDSIRAALERPNA